MNVQQTLPIAEAAPLGIGFEDGLDSATDTPRTDAVYEFFAPICKTPPFRYVARHARELERELNIAKSTIESCDDTLKRIDGICDAAGIPRDDGDEKGLRVQFCEGHRVKLLLEKYKRIAATPNADLRQDADSAASNVK